MIDDLQMKRRRYVAFCRYSERYKAQQERAGLWLGQYPLPKCPDDLRDLTCGARTRKGTSCKRRDLYDNGRCRLHGGLSTGPRTEAGKQQSRVNGMKGGRPRKNQTPCDPSKSLSQTDSSRAKVGTEKTEPREVVTNGNVESSCVPDKP